MKNQIILGDCKEELLRIKSNSVQLILTDPPYELGSFRKKIGKWEKTEVCNSNVFQECNRILVDGGHLMCFTANRTIHKFGTAIEKANFEIRDTLIWEYTQQSIPRNMDVAKAIDAQMLYGKTSSKYLKQVEQEYGGEVYTIQGTNNTMFGDKVTFQRKEYSPITEQAKKWEGWGTNLAPKFEPLIMARKKFKGSLAENIINNKVGAINIEKLTNINSKFPSNILTFSKEKREDFNNHPMVKPTKLLEYIILMTTKEGDTVLDPFAGSESTLLACKNTNRNYIGIETNEDYIKIIHRRLGKTYNEEIELDKTSVL